MKEAVTKVIDTHTQEDFYGAFQKLLERYNKCMAAEEITSKGTRVSYVYYQSKCPYEKSGNLFNISLSDIFGKAMNCLFPERKVE